MSDWPPPEARYGSALRRGERHLLRGEWYAASTCFSAAAELAGEGDRESVRALFHLAVAGYKRQRGDERGAARQLSHARRRLGGAATAAGLDVAPLLARVGPG